jgi:hypothetical protein
VGEDLWTRWFLTMRTGRKSDEIRAAGRVTLAYQHNGKRDCDWEEWTGPAAMTG